MHRLDGMAEGSLHGDNLSDICDALGSPRRCNWAAGVQKQYAILGMAPPSLSDHVDREHACSQY